MSTEPPPLNLTTKRRFTIPLMGTVGAGPAVGLTVVAGPITFPFRVVGAEIVFRNDTANLLQIYLLIANNQNTSTGTPPPDRNLFSPNTPTAYFLGESLIKRVVCDSTSAEDEIYIKAHAVNGCAYPQMVNVTVEIEEA